MINFEIRQAVPEDAQSIENLYKILVPADVNIHVTTERVVEIANNPHNFLFVIGSPGSVYGTAFLTLCLDPMYGSMPYAVLENIIIDGTKRHQGYGRALLETIEQFCWSERCTKIMFLSSIHRTDAHRFFATFGFLSDKKKAFVKYRSSVFQCTPVSNRSSREGE